MAALLTLLAAAGYVLPVAGQLSGTVGPTTSTASKASTKVCSILDYGGEASKTTDNADAITKAWDACKTGGQVYIPEGDYGLATWVTLTGGQSVSINLEGTIYRTGTASGNMIFIEHTKDFEFYSATSKGAIQGYGYEFHKDGNTDGPRLLRGYELTDYSFHDIILVDSPVFHLSLDTCTNGEVYNMVIHGGYSGGLDGIDVWSDNTWVHDIEVSNKDECVTVKSPANNLLVEQVHCNWSGGCGMGSLAEDTQISNVKYQYIYTHDSNQMYLIKSNGGSGTVENAEFSNFMGHSNAYTLDVDTAWSSMDTASGDGVQYTNMSFTGWTGTCADGVERGPVKVICPAEAPCTDISITDFNVWTDSGDTVYQECANAFGSGACLADGDGSSTYSSTATLTTASDYSYQTMDNELSTPFDISAEIPIPTMPASFYPGRNPISAFLNGNGGGGGQASASASASASNSASATLPDAFAQPSATTTTSASMGASPAPTGGWGSGRQGGGPGGRGFRGVGRHALY